MPYAFLCDDKNRLKLFIYSQWTTKWSPIDQLTIVTFAHKRNTKIVFSCVQFQQGRHTMRSLSNHINASFITDTRRILFSCCLFVCFHLLGIFSISKIETTKTEKNESLLLSVNPGVNEIRIKHLLRWSVNFILLQIFFFIIWIWFNTLGFTIIFIRFLD